MKAQLKRAWKSFKSAPAGHRFHKSWQRRHAQGGSRMATVGFVLLGVALILAGTVFLVIPGPGIPIVAIGLSLIAREWLPGAKALDAIELKLRALLHRIFPKLRRKHS